MVCLLFVMKYLTLAIHYPKPENRNDILRAMQQLALEAQKMPGLIEMSPWIDEKTNKIIAKSLWQSKEEWLACWQKLSPLADRLGSIHCIQSITAVR